MPSHTRGKWTQDIGSIDYQLFINATKFQDTSGLSTIVSSGVGDLHRAIAASHACTFFTDLGTFIRTGELATPNNSQRQFGTAASQPGPSSAAGTSDPLAMVGFPPYTAAMNPTIAPASGPVAKGVKIRWVDFIYLINTVALTAITAGLTKTVYQNDVAAVVSNIIILGVNGLSAFSQGQPFRVRVTPPTANQIYQVSDGSELLLNLNMTTPAGGTANFYGAVIGCELNYN